METASIPQSRWEPELKKAATSIHLLALRYSIVVFLLAAIPDYYNFPTAWLPILAGRIGVAAAIGACIFLFGKGKMNVYWLITLPFTMMGIISSVAYALAETDFVLALNCTIFALSVVFSFFAIVKFHHTATVVSLTLVAIFFFVFLNPHYTFLEWLYSGGFLPIISAAVVFLLIRVRISLNISEICSRLALHDSHLLLDEKNRSLKEAKIKLEKVNAHLEETVRLRTESLRKSNAERDEMVYRLSHDFKTPMINIRSLVDLARNESDPEKVKQIYGLIDHSIQRFESLVTSMDQFVTYTQKSLNLRPTNLPILIEETWRRIALHQGTTMQLELERPLPNMVHSDPDKLKMVLECLMRNAIQFQREGQQGLLRVTWTQVEGFLRVRLQDNGTGIQASVLQKVSDLFFRGDNRSKGLGIGLYLAKGTMEQLQGQLHISSDPHGTTVELTLPLQQAA